MKNKIQGIVNRFRTNSGVEKITRVELISNLEFKLRIYYTVTKEFAKENDLFCRNRIFECTENVGNPFVSMDYADTMLIDDIDLEKI